MNSANHKDIKEIRKILGNLEDGIDVMNSLVKFRDIMLVNENNDLIVLVIQKVHNILYSSCNIEYVEILLDIIRSEEAFDELFRIILSFGNNPYTLNIVSKLRKDNELIIFKYLKELKNNISFSSLSREMDKRYSEILDTINFNIGKEEF
ncbi:hypothetical protein EHEL_060030 [Encephalitozoon hellem ATCC 50504]|uniref:Immunity protein 30 domain-containing protein n=1 Tax=Encephalitozoon hellem TaxID=27973 RepID=A0A9Q9C898_ENCHE|nr:uncharacterized protein EHEL_060030 [Encephalitozoon hellem ATCC 50504]AFM98377.1 hypothetical protein EHEL_060030 [Encephalitozoon hellem ATCC 50504]UTX43295.1 hypothetical protein GPU96_06g10410 [Encephalitozoon hellem]WEL38756.1 hypothetical protein PFJ87_06g00210 [Encephalitozoon hellem]|eukprot:XP_003887358.1 hypothetical protein EHEL_060030 [Encephalitozoon hellem ATCC 50504]